MPRVWPIVWPWPGCAAHDVVFRDVRLPDGNGLGMPKNLRESPGRADVFINAHTGAGDPDGVGASGQGRRLRLQAPRLFFYPKGMTLSPL